MLLLGLISPSAMGQNNFEKEWKQVKQLVDRGLPQSALEIVDSIYAVSKSDNNAVQFLKAALYQVRLRSDYQEGFMESSIGQMEQEITSAEQPVRQVLSSILAELYWRFYQGNRMKILDRTTTTIPDPDDFNTWNLRTLVERTTFLYEASLDAPSTLQAVSLINFDPILETSEGSKDYRPTLYDLLAHRALDYFMNDEASLTKPAERFELDKTEYFLPATDFASLELFTKDKTSLKFRALETFQGLLGFHGSDTDPKALIDADLKRLQFVWNNSTLSNKQDLYIGALKNLVEKYNRYPGSTEASYEIATVYSIRGGQYNPFTQEKYRWELKKAREICEEAIRRFPESKGAKNCQILLEQLIEKQMNITLRYASLPSSPFLANLKYKNFDKVYFRLISLNPEQERNIRQNNRKEAILNQYLGMPYIESWVQNLPDEGDLQFHSVQLKMPAANKGFYVLLASSTEDFNTDKGPIVYASFWVTNLSYVSNRSFDGSTEIFVLDREKGTPVAGVSATTFIREYDYSTRKYSVREQNTYITDGDGYISIPSGAEKSRSFYIRFTKKDDHFYTENYFYQNPEKRPAKAKDITYFFTDRAIYRPGQTIYFKGILLEKDKDGHSIKAGESTLVELYDVNNQRISELLLKTNEFGSFEGAFTAPTALLTGMMQIRNESGRATVRVEEYKRPRFRIAINPLEGNYRLNEMVKVTGEAMAYAGNPIDGAVVKYRVVRQAIFPFWRSWWNIWPQGETMEITNGTTSTDENGSFAIDFMAIPDLSISAENKPVFNYTIYLDVTDINGETHSTESSVSVAMKSLYLSSSIPEDLDITGDIVFNIHSKNLNGKHISTKGSINVYPLRSPGRVLRDRNWERPDVFVMNEKEFRKEFPNDIYDGEDNPENWERGQAIFSFPFDTEVDSLVALLGLSAWKPGIYLLEMKAPDAFGEMVTSEQYITAFDPSSGTMPGNEPLWKYAIKKKAEPGETVSMLFGSAEKDVRVLYEIVNKDKLVSREWVKIDQEIRNFDVPVEESYRGNFSLRFMFVKGNRSYSIQEFIKVPYTNKELDIRMETFRDRLTPGQEEEWRLRISGKQGDKVSAELLASMYDASLDVFATNTWSFNLYSYTGSGPAWDVNDAFSAINGKGVYKKIRPYQAPSIRTYDQLNWFGFNYYRLPGYFRDMNAKGMAVPGMARTLAEPEAMAADTGPEKQAQVEEPEKPQQEEQKVPEVKIRRNFEETAFFFPKMKTDENGDVLLKFTVPESLTAWKFMGLAHTTDLKTGYIEKQVTTNKELMVVPNPPRFFREGDGISFSSKVVSLSENTLKGKVTAEFFDALSMKPVDILLDKESKEKSFFIEKGKSQTFSWDINIPEGLEAIVYRVVAVSSEFSDGEEMAVPVLPNRMLVTETMPLPVRGKSTNDFTMRKLLNSGPSKTIKDYRLTLEFTSNPAWYAIQALPYLMENENESANSLFTRLYANSLAGWIANSSPRIRQVFESWKEITPDALLSNLEKNQELKSVMMEETPWVLMARSENEQKKRVALLFDLNRMANEQFTAASKLIQMQLPNGGWPWFKGMKDSPFITQNIISGIGRLQHMGVIDLKNDPIPYSMVRRAVYYMDQRMQEYYEKIKKKDPDRIDKDHLSPLLIQYLYGRSFFMDLISLDKQYEEAFAYFQGQAVSHWLNKNKYLQGMTALALKRLDDDETSAAIIRSLKEHALYSEELGMYWRESNGYFWHELPVERQSMLIEAFLEVSGDLPSVEKMKIWLLKQKQTQMWRTGKATADAVYALLLQGTNLLVSDQLVEVTVGSETIDPFNRDDVTVEAGTGYFQTSWADESIKPSMGKVKVVKKDEGVAWGALYWQYFEDLDKITAAETPLSLEKELYREDDTETGPMLTPLNDKQGLKTGNKVVVRIVLRVDRDMEFVHMKDMRAATFEPVNFLSGYRYQGGLGYYEAPKDASMNFYFHYLRKGTYVFEYALMATQKGEFSNGITTIQCMYAPEFSSHSEGVRVSVE
jgi:hypothetical protein